MAVASFIEFCAHHNLAQPPDKIVKNLCTFLCQDDERTPTFAYNRKHLSAILSFPTSSSANDTGPKEEYKAESAHKAKISRRGAGLAFVQLLARFGPRMLDTVPKMWQSMAGGLLSACDARTYTKTMLLIRLIILCRIARGGGPTRRTAIRPRCY